MRRLCSLFISTFLLLGSCTDYSVTKIIETAPEIVVEPAEHDFGHVNAQGISETTSIHVSNAGTEDLHISSINVVGNLTFSMSAVGAHAIEPGNMTTVNVTFDPTTYENSLPQVEIRSNDEDEPLVVVPLVGAGDAPVVYVAPDEYDFESVILGCNDEVNILIGNIGNVDLEVNNINFFASVPVLMPSNISIVTILATSNCREFVRVFSTGLSGLGII